MFKRVTCLALAAAVLAGCGSAPSSAPQPSSQPQQAPAATQPAKQLTPVKLSVTVQVLSFAPLFVALDGGLFEKHGLKVQEVDTQGGGPGTEALESGGVQFDTTDSGTLAAAVSHGVPVLAIESCVNNVTLNMVIRKAVADKLHLSRQMPLAEREKALKGLKLGVTSPGSASDLFTRWYLKQAGLDPVKDAQIVTIGGGPSLLAALKQGQIDTFLLSPPTPEQAVAGGYGTMLIAASQGDVPQFKNFAYEVMSTTPKYAQAHPEIVKAFAQAVADGNNLIREHQDQALQILSKRFSKVPPDILKESLAAIAPAVPAGGAFTEEDWQHALEIEQETGMLKGTPLSAKEGTLWTNEYVK